jgi:hypothetical protein
MDLPRLNYGGITDIHTAKSVARRLFQTYTHGDTLDRKGMEKMLVDTYRLMVELQGLR